MNDYKRMAIRGGLFAALVGLELYLVTSMSNSPSIKGYVETRSFGVSASSKAIVRKIDVTLGQHVEAGQLIAELDGTSLDSDVAVAMAQRNKLIASARAGTGDDDALQVVDTRLEQLAERRSALRLVAPSEGIIESIDLHPGDAVSPDFPVATIVAADTRHVVACVPEQRISEVDVGSTAEVTSVVGQQRLAGTVESLTPAIAELPARCQNAIARPLIMGRIAMILLDRPANLLPGQSELIGFGDRTTGKLPSAVVEAPMPALIDVPRQISAISRFEASGLVWIPSLMRYVVVSDETGLDDHHPPWLFTMSKRGVVDPEPMVISDVSELDDLESIAAGDAGALWIAASQSLSAKGNRPRARQVLARLVPEAAGYKVDKKIHLFELLAAAPALLQALAITDVEKLDIEAIAWHGGALYLGLKTPVDTQGRAVIWKVSAPDKLLAGDLVGAGFTVWGSVNLPVQVGDRSVAGGIADMVFVSDSMLLVGATASGDANAKHQDGVVYSVVRATNSLTAIPVQAFRDLKPEGVAAAPEAGRFVVVFDRGREAPMWTPLELPTGL